MSWSVVLPVVSGLLFVVHGAAAMTTTPNKLDFRERYGYPPRLWRLLAWPHLLLGGGILAGTAGLSAALPVGVAMAVVHPAVFRGGR